MRSSSSSVSPRARWSGCSGATCVKGPSVAGKPDRLRVRFSSCEPPSSADAAGPGGVLQASMPLFTAVLVYGFSRNDRVTGLRLAGVVVGFLGVLLLVGAQP